MFSQTLVFVGFLDSVSRGRDVGKGKAAYIWISSNPAYVGPTLGGGVVVVIVVRHPPPSSKKKDTAERTLTFVLNLNAPPAFSTHFSTDCTIWARGRG